MENPFNTKKLRKTKARTMIISILSHDKDRSFSVEELHTARGAANRSFDGISNDAYAC